jgi:hypothetical protein
MKRVLDELKNGNVQIASYFKEADRLWTDLLADIDSLSIDVLSEKIGTAQYYFEDICQERHLAKLIMGWSSVPHFYSNDTTFDEDDGERAYKLSLAIAKSTCSGEVKVAAREMANLYCLKDYA